MRRLLFEVITLLCVVLVTSTSPRQTPHTQTRQPVHGRKTSPSANTCIVDDCVFQSGERFFQECNACTCGSNGQGFCTLKGCSKDFCYSPVTGEAFRHGETDQGCICKKGGWQCPEDNVCPWQTTPKPGGHFHCRHRHDGTYPDLEDCTKFYKCSNGIASSFSCPDGLLFDIKTYHCEWPKQATCAECPESSFWSSCGGMCRPSCARPNPPCPLICAQGCACYPGFVWFGNKCIAKHMCPHKPGSGQEGTSDGPPIIPYTYSSDPERKQKSHGGIRPPLPVRGTTSSSVAKFSCEGLPDGDYADPEDCSMFYECSNGIAYHMPCPAGLYFNEETDQCDSPANVDCGTSQPCPDGWLGNQRSCYLLVDQSRTWQEARDACHQLQADLASLTTANEQTFMEIYVQTVGAKYWIGLNDIVVEDDWQWVDGTEYDPAVTNWNPDEPNNKYDENCVEVLANGRWNDEECTDMHGYICERRTVTSVNRKTPTRSPLPHMSRPGTRRPLPRKSRSDGEFSCKGLPDGNYPDPEDCSKYYSCSNGNPNHMSCPKDLYYNTKTDACDYPENVDCDPNHCECDATGAYPCCSPSGNCGNTPEYCTCVGCYDPRRCGPDYPEQDGSPGKCENPLYPCCSPEGWCGNTPDYCDCQGCDPGAYVRVKTRAQIRRPQPAKTASSSGTYIKGKARTPAKKMTRSVRETCNGKPDGSFADPEDCHSYYVCHDGHLYHYSCGEMYYNPNTGSCIFNEAPNCAQFTCDGKPNGNYADPKDCSKYYSCSNGNAIQMSCPEGLYYNEKLGVCDYPENVDCV